MTDRSASSLRNEGFGQTLREADVYVIELRKQKDERGGAEESEWLLVERREHVERDPANGDVEEATLRVYYWCLTDDFAKSDVPDGEFSAFYECRNNGVSITSASLWRGGYVIVEPQRLRGFGLGTYLMNVTVMWAKRWPAASVRQIELPKGEGPDTEGQRRRVHFYGKFGIRFDFPDSTPITGIARPMLASELVEVRTWEKTITRHNIVVAMRSLICEQSRNLAEMGFLRRSLKNDGLVLMNAQLHPIKWAFQRIVTDNPGQTLMACAFAFVICFGIYRVL